MKRISGNDLKMKRMAAGISGEIVCARAGMSRSRLCAIERHYIIPDQAEMARINSVIEELVLAATKLRKTARELGLSAVHC